MLTQRDAGFQYCSFAMESGSGEVVAMLQHRRIWIGASAGGGLEWSEANDRRSDTALAFPHLY